jgi:hypothetical protein
MKEKYSCSCESNLLFNEHVNKTEEYCYKIEVEGEKAVIIIVFENEMFERVSFPFGGPYTRSEWRILAAIERQITEIEEKYAKGGKAP